MVTAWPVTEVVVRLPDTGSNSVKSALAIACLPCLNANPPIEDTCTVTVSDAPVHGTPGKSLLKNPLPWASLWPLTWLTLTSPNATFNVGSHVNVKGTETETPSGPSCGWPIDSCVEIWADTGDGIRASAKSAIGTTKAQRENLMALSPC